MSTREYNKRAKDNFLKTYAGNNPEGVFNSMVKEAESVYAASKPAQRELDDLAGCIARDMGIHYETGTPKSPMGIVDKVGRKRAKDNSYGPMDLNDHVRTKVELKSYDDIPEFIERLESKGVDGVEYEIKNEPTSGYKSFHITYRTADDFGAEIQLTTPELWKAKQESEAIYAKWRGKDDVTKMSPEMRAEYTSDMLRSQSLWDSLSEETGKLGNDSISDLVGRRVSNQRSRVDNPSKAEPSPMGTQEPSINSSQGSNTTTRPESVIMGSDSVDINKSPFEKSGSIISEGGKMSNNGTEYSDTKGRYRGDGDWETRPEKKDISIDESFGERAPVMGGDQGEWEEAMKDVPSYSEHMEQIQGENDKSTEEQETQTDEFAEDEQDLAGEDNTEQGVQANNQTEAEDESSSKENTEQEERASDLIGDTDELSNGNNSEQEEQTKDLNESLGETQAMKNAEQKEHATDLTEGGDGIQSKTSEPEEQMNSLADSSQEVPGEDASKGEQNEQAADLTDGTSQNESHAEDNRSEQPSALNEGQADTDKSSQDNESDESHSYGY